MVRRSKATKLLDINFEIVLIIVLIIVAILFVCFLNKKFKSTEGFYVDVPSDQKQIHFFYAEWCGYSKKYLEDTENGIANLRQMITNNKLIGRLLEHDVEKTSGQDAAKAANVEKLPSFYKYEKGKYTIFEGEIDNQKMIDWLKE